MLYSNRFHENMFAKALRDFSPQANYTMTSNVDHEHKAWCVWSICYVLSVSRKPCLKQEKMFRSLVSAFFCNSLRKDKH
jgi:hypothetical protein